jgi:hypothetical protein
MYLKCIVKTIKIYIKKVLGYKIFYEKYETFFRTFLLSQIFLITKLIYADTNNNSKKIYLFNVAENYY